MSVSLIYWSVMSFGYLYCVAFEYSFYINTRDDLETATTAATKLRWIILKMSTFPIKNIGVGEKGKRKGKNTQKIEK